MKQKFSKAIGVIILGSLLFLAAYKKDDITPPPVSSQSVQFTISTLPGESLGQGGNLFALVSPDGYLVKLVRKFKSNQTGQYLFTTKTTYTY